MSFRAGQRVEVRFDATVQEPQAHNDQLVVVTKDGDVETHWLVKRAYVTAIDPAYWPPQPGDIWRTEAGFEYVIREAAATSEWAGQGYEHGFTVVSKLDCTAPGMGGRTGWANLKAANPELIRRRGMTL